MSADVAETIWYQEDSASPITVLKPASFASGQMLVVVITQHNNPSAQTDMSTPTGWTLQGALDGVTSDGKVFSYVFTGSDPASWDFPYRSTADVVAGVFRVTGADVATPTFVIATSPTTTMTSSYDSPTATPTGADDLALLVLANHGNGTVLTETDPSGTTDLGQGQVTGNFFAMAAVKKQLSSSAATGAFTWTSVGPTGNTGGSYTILIKSAAGGTGWTQTPTDSAGLTDSTALDRTMVASDSAGLTDSTALARTSVATDVAGLTDGVLLARTLVQTDDAGLTDGASVQAAKLVTATDDAGLTDATVLSRTTVVSDTVGLTDGVIAGRAAVYTDVAGLTDSAAYTVAPVAVDVVGLTDGWAFTVAAAYTDVAGLTDGVLLLAPVYATDSAGLTDSSSVVAASAFPPAPAWFYSGDTAGVVMLGGSSSDTGPGGGSDRGTATVRSGP